MNRRTIIAIAAVIVLAVGWYLFRPERLFVNAKVNEKFPTASTAPGQVTLLQGNFHDRFNLMPSRVTQSAPVQHFDIRPFDAPVGAERDPFEP